jgi:uncharacterized membrane protein (DUF485 family)
LSGGKWIVLQVSQRSENEKGISRNDNKYLREVFMAKSVHDIVNSPKFKSLVSTRWTVSFILTFLLFVVYYGYILLVAYNKEFLAEKIGVYTNYGIVLGVLVIVLAWILTFIYVLWANFSYDKKVEELKKEIQ